MVTGFNDRRFQTRTGWEDDASDRLVDYPKPVFPRARFDPEPVDATMTAHAASEVDTNRNLEPKPMFEETKRLIGAPWSRTAKIGQGKRPANPQGFYDMRPETQVSGPTVA
ncbi:hypothetical protein [Nonomuraea jabiensis]|uniref:hypothetical protein n=1 Tax=Nonomuraea jabiensis TaxID=882448 RepID=UPI0036B0E2CA